MRCDSLDAWGAACAWLLGLALGACETASLPPPIAAAGSGGSPVATGLAGRGPAAAAGSGPVPADAGAPLTAPAPTAGSAPLQPMAAGPSGCGQSYTTALRARADMSWPETIGLVGGQGKLTFWTKLKHTPRADGGEDLDSTPCGVALPVVTTSPLLAGIRLFNEIPTASFNLPSMPRYTSRAMWQAGKLVNDTGAIMLGIALADPSVPWPQRAALNPADHDGDGKPGVTAFPKSGAGFALPPADIGQTQQADQVYIASRLRLKFSAAEAGCDRRVEGTVEPNAFDYAIVGCHVFGGDECKANQANLLYNNSPVFTLGTRGESTSIPVAPNATCEELIGLLPAE